MAVIHGSRCPGLPWLADDGNQLLYLPFEIKKTKIMKMQQK